MIPICFLCLQRFKDKLLWEVLTSRLPQPNKCPRDQQSRSQTHEKLAGLPQSGESSHLSQSISAFWDLELGEQQWARDQGPLRKKGGGWGQGRKTCYPFGVVYQLLLHPCLFPCQSALNFMGDTWGSWALTEKQTWLDERTWCTSASGEAGKEGKASGHRGELQKLATHLATPTHFGTLLFFSQILSNISQIETS